MPQLAVTRTISAPLARVFNTVADINQFSQAVPAITKVEILSEVKSGVGTRFRETRLMKGKESTTELEVTEYVSNDRVRLVADSHDIVWDSVFQVRSAGGQTVMTMTMDARTDKLIPKIMMWLIWGMLTKAVERDMDSVKAFCEQEHPS